MDVVSDADGGATRNRFDGPYFCETQDRAGAAFSGGDPAISTLVFRKTLVFGLSIGLTCILLALLLQIGQKILEGQTLALHRN